jgi:hypothetical protein
VSAIVAEVEPSELELVISTLILVIPAEVHPVADVSVVMGIRQLHPEEHEVLPSQIPAIEM